MSSMTHREYKLRVKWFESMDVEPNKTDWYLMQVASLVEWLASGSRRPRPLGKFKLKWGRGRTDREQSEHSKSTWLSAFGIKEDGD